MTVMSFTGLHEVARELENPFMNVPNDLPCNNFQGQFNEALMTMFAGYHPDAFWHVAAKPVVIKEDAVVVVDEKTSREKDEGGAGEEEPEKGEQENGTDDNHSI